MRASCPYPTQTHLGDLTWPRRMLLPVYPVKCHIRISEATWQNRLLNHWELQEKSSVGSIYSLTADQWLRVLREQPLSNLPNVVYCPRCVRVHSYGYPEKRNIATCHRYGTAVVPLDKEFWQRVSKLIRASYRRDRWLFARVKAEFPGWQPLTLEGPLAWMNDAWRQAPKPRGKPQEIAERFFIARWVGHLSERRWVFEVKPEEQPRWRILRPLMSRAQAIQVLKGIHIGEGSTFLTAGGRRLTFGGLSNKTLRQLSETFQGQAERLFGKVPALNAREVQRVLKWVHRVQEDANYRVKGGKPRRRKFEIYDASSQKKALKLRRKSNHRVGPIP